VEKSLALHSRFAAIIGNILNHYDSSLFGWVAPYLAPILFPGKGGMEALLLTFAFLPLNYMTKPLGACFWGWIGDRWGRKPALTASLIGMALSTSAIGCLPLIEHAWIFLALCRAFQGFFAAGEEKGAALYLLEHSAPEKRAWMSAIYDASGIIGIFLASFLASQFGENHWRLLFWLGAAAGLFGVFLRHHAEESPEFKPAPFSWKILWEHRNLISRISIVAGFSYANYFLVTVFLNGFLPKITALSKADVLLFNTHLLWIDFFLLLGFGALCRWIPKAKLMATAAFLTALLAIPLFASLDNASWWHAAVVRLLFVTFGVALAAPYHAWKLEHLPIHHRFLIGSVASTLGSKLFGAPMPFIATYLVSQTGLTWTAALPLVILGSAATGVLLLKPLASRKIA
jgi:MFS transporter, MHS family, proline/betaine transporter